VCIKVQWLGVFGTDAATSNLQEAVPCLTDESEGKAPPRPSVRHEQLGSAA